MKKKTLITILAAVLIVGGLGGYLFFKNKNHPVIDPENQNPVSKIAVLQRAEDDSGLIVFLDRSNSELGSITIPYPIMALYNDHSVYYSYDGDLYESYNFIEKKKKKDITVAGEEYPLSMCDDGSYVGYQEGTVYFHCCDGNDSSSTIYLSDGGVTNKDLYCLIDSANNLCVYDLSDNYNLLYKETMSSNECLFLAVVAGDIYVVNDYGLTRVSREGISMTYTYQVGFNSIYNVVMDHLFLQVGEDVKAYKIDFDKYHLILTEDNDKELYQDVDFETMFAQYYQQGYQMFDFYVY